MTCDFCLNPYSNGMKIEYFGEDTPSANATGVLILILME